LATAAVVLLGIVVAALTWWPGADEVDSPQGAVGVESDAPQGLPALEFRPTAREQIESGQFSGPLEPIAGYDNRFRVSGGFRPPTKVHDISPIYPEEALAAGVQGLVILDIVIGQDGTVVEVAVERSVPLLDQAAIEAVRQWRFEITQINGESIEVAMIVTVNFRLG